MDFVQEIQGLLKPHLPSGAEILLEVPPDVGMGDYAFPCFALAKGLKKKPAEIATQLSEQIKPTKNIEKIEVHGPYVNFFVNKVILVRDVLQQVQKDYGKGGKKKEKIMVEYSGPNPFKAFHIGHLRNTVLGDSLIRILKFNGYDVIAVNYLNDTGAHVAKCLWAYLKFHKDEKPPEHKGEWLGEIYAEAEAKLQENKEYEEEVRELQRKIEAKDASVMKHFTEKKGWSEDDFNTIYTELEAHFDRVYYDSDYINKGKEVVKELEKKKITKEDEGAMLVDLEKYGLNKVLILRSDKTALYITKDLAMAIDRLNEYKLDRMIYVVGAEQKLHFQQFFKILELAGYKEAKKCFHLSYELVMLEEGRMASRAGMVILYSQLRDQMMEHAVEEVEKRHPDWSPKRIQESARNIAFGAMKFGMLHQDNNKIIRFNIKQALDFEGETGPYLQYTHARIASILKRHDQPVSKKFDPARLQTAQELALVKQLQKFPTVVEECAAQYRPPVMTYYLLELGRAFNEFYHACPVLKAEPAVRDARLVLIQSVKQVLGTGLSLLGIVAPEEM